MILVQSPLSVKSTWSEVYAKCVESFFATVPNAKLFRSTRITDPLTDKELVLAMLQEGVRFLQWVGGHDLTQDDIVMCFDPFASVERLPFVTKARKAVYLHQETGRYYGCDAPIVETLWNAWAQFEKVYVPTQYTAMALGISEQPNVASVGGMLDYDDYYEVADKEPTVVWAARVCEEKGVREFVEAIPVIEAMGYEAIMLTNNVQDKGLLSLIPEGILREGVSKEQYKDYLARAQFFVSTARQETFGVAAVEAVASGCKVIVPSAVSYISMFPATNRYRAGRLKTGLEAAMRTAVKLRDKREFDYRATLTRVLNGLNRP